MDFQRSEKTMDHEIPRLLRAVLSQVNGMIWIMDKELLSVSRLTDVYLRVQSHSMWRGDLFPFAGDESSLLVISESTGAVCEWDSEDGLGDDVAHSLASYLEKYRDELLEGHCEFVAGVGIVEKLSRSRK